MSLWDYIGKTGKQAEAAGASTPADADSIRRIISSLEQLEPARARHIAAFAFVLARVARADMVISKEETAAMERIIMDQAGLPEEQAVLVVEIARHQNLLLGGTENFLVTRELKATATPEEKDALLRCLFAVSAADESISTAEEGIVAQIASELGIDRQDMLRVRSEYRQWRAVHRPR
ncbi:MAG: TerB family tellurite resistance protein [Candidatus Polarisedimenticolia bacterium]